MSLSTHTAPRYADVLGVSSQEQQRLLDQAQYLKPEACWLLDRLGVGTGWRAIDLGCGPLGILDLLSERVGPQGEVLGLDREPQFVELARAFVAERGLPNVQVVRGDAADTGLPRASFDLVHARGVLVSPIRERIVAEMVALARAGGFVAAQEPDLLTLICEPAHPAWDALLGGFRTLVGRHGVDLTAGRRLPGLLRQAGLQKVDVEVHTGVARPGAPRRAELLALIASVRESLIRTGTFAEEELTSLTISLGQHLDDPNTLIMSTMWIKAWGQKPTL